MRRNSAVKMKKNAQEPYNAYVSVAGTMNRRLVREGDRPTRNFDGKSMDFFGRAFFIQALHSFKNGFRRFITGVEIIVLVVAVVSGFAFWTSFTAPDKHIIENIHVVGHQPQIVEDEMRERLLPYRSKGFFAIELGEIQKSLAEIPWIREVKVNRKWPDSIVINVDTWQPVAKWGEGKWLDETGKLFTLELAIDDNSNMPLLQGPEEDAVQVFKMYQQITQLFNVYDVKLKSLKKVQSGGWVVKMDSGIEVRLKKDDVFEGLRSFVKLYNELGGQRDNVEYVDMRYPDGAAISWRNGKLAAINGATVSSANIQ
jgi:cell division protein FtsQ